MAKLLRCGVCHICGKHGKLSFEHVPPESAFNRRKVTTPDVKRVFQLTNLDDLTSLAGKQSQRGQGGYTLCDSCNNLTGRWYGANYATWVYQGAAYLGKSEGLLRLSYPYYLFPLRVIKQIICMFFSVNSQRFRECHPELEKFILNKKEKYLPQYVRLYAGYVQSDRSRLAGVTGSIDFVDGVSRIYSEISFPPFSYILSLSSLPPEGEALSFAPPKKVPKEKAARMPLIPCVPRSRRGLPNGASCLIGNAMHPCIAPSGLIPPKAPVLGAAYGRKPSRTCRGSPIGNQFEM